MNKPIEVNDLLVKKFWPRVAVGTRNECWVWTGPKNNKGYGVMCYKKKVGCLLVHRVSWTIHFGEIGDGLCVCHHCDNPLCVHPGHLFLGTQKENIANMISKGRDRFGGDQSGAKNNNSKLTSIDVVKIRSLIKCGHRQTDIAKWFGIDQTTVSNINTGKTWPHLLDIDDFLPTGDMADNHSSDLGYGRISV